MPVLHERLELPAQPRTCRAVRELLHGLADVLPAALLDDMILAANELVARSLRNRRTDDPLVFEVRANRYEITIALEDTGGSWRPRSPVVTTDDTRDLGAVIVDALADRWGVEERHGVTRSWLTFALPSPSDADVLRAPQEVAADLDTELRLAR